MKLTIWSSKLTGLWSWGFEILGEYIESIICFSFSCMVLICLFKPKSPPKIENISIDTLILADGISHYFRFLKNGKYIHGEIFIPLNECPSLTLPVNSDIYFSINSMKKSSVFTLSEFGADRCMLDEKRGFANDIFFFNKDEFKGEYYYDSNLNFFTVKVVNSVEWLNWINKKCVFYNQ